MARKGREKSGSGIYMLLLRSKSALFNNDTDFDVFIELMRRHFTNECRLYAYCLMPHAVCLLMRESGEGISKDIKPAVTSYARYYNRTYNCEGKLFTDRFKSEPCEDRESFLNNIAFIHSVAGYCNTDFRSSVLDYKNGGICDTSEAKGDLKIKRLCLFDYSLVDDASLRKMLLDIMANYGDDMDNSKFREFIKEQGYISYSRACIVMNRAPKKNAQKKNEKTAKTNKEEKNTPKKQLPSWLL